MNKKCLEYGKKASVIRELAEFSKKRKLEVGENNVYDFSIGNPSIPTPKEVDDILISLLKKDDTTSVHSYSSDAGFIKSREKVAKVLSIKYNHEFDARYIYLTCGAAAGLSISLKALLEKDDEVILFAPFFPEYSVYIDNAMGKEVIVKPNLKDFTPDLKDFENKITPKTKAVIINSPNNPSGAIYKEDILEKISEILNKRQNEYKTSIYIISDEPYRELVYDDYQIPCIMKFYKNSIICYSYSKCLSLPGERIGYIALNPNNDETKELFYAISGAGRSLGYLCAPTLYQLLLENIDDITSDFSIYRKNRDYLYLELTKIGYEMPYPSGAFYIFLKALEDDEEHFSKVAQEYNLVFVPSSTFGIKGYVRISYSINEEVAKNSISAFKKLYERYRK